MRSFCAALVICGAALCGGCGAGPTATRGDPKDYEQLKGTWHAIEIETGGIPVPAGRVKEINLRYIFNRDKISIHRSDGTIKTSTFAIDSSTKPKRLTIHQSPAIRAVYAVERNKLRLCVMVDDNPNAGYPTELTSKASPKTDLLTLERR
jgi:uncharacterized protein (TIGR03067 family)